MSCDGAASFPHGLGYPHAVPRLQQAHQELAPPGSPGLLWVSTGAAMSARAIFGVGMQSGCP